MKAKNLTIALAMGTLLAFAGAASAAVVISGKNEQNSNIQGAVVNVATGMKATAKQNISSNKGKVEISGDNKQTTNIQGAVVNVASGMLTTAEQNVSSNDGNK
jgi:hypothetical protein